VGRNKVGRNWGAGGPTGHAVGAAVVERHRLLRLLGTEDSLLFPGRNGGAPPVPSHPKRLPSSSWGGKGLRGAGLPPAAPGDSQGLWVQLLFA